MDRVRNLVFKYLDGLFENIKINKTEDTLSGRIGKTMLFYYDYDSHTIYFDNRTFNLIRDMFGIKKLDIEDYILTYLSRKIKRELSNANFDVLY